MGVTRPIGFKGERKILPRSSRRVVTSSNQDVKKDNQAKDGFQDSDGLRTQLMEIWNLKLNEIHSKFSRDSGICEDFDLPTSEDYHKVNKFAGINIDQTF